MSGVPTTIAGVAAAALIPIQPSPAAPNDATSPLHWIEHRLHPGVAFGIVPLFGFANTDISLAHATLATVIDPLVFGIALGLFVGKHAGIFGAV